MGLRERKKLQTREAIASAALKLFAEKGFRETTLKEIAEAADVSQRTVSSYFPSKEDLVFPGTEDFLESFEAMLAEREPGESTYMAVRSWAMEVMCEMEKDREQQRVRRQLVEAEPALRNHELGTFGRLEEMVAAAVAEDLSASPGDLVPRLSAAAFIAMIDALDRDLTDHDQPDVPMTELAKDHVEVVTRFLRAGIEATAR